MNNENVDFNINLIYKTQYLRRNNKCKCGNENKGYLV